MIETGTVGSFSKYNHPSPEYITINQNGSIQRGINKIDCLQLKELVKKRVGKEGIDIPVIFIVDKNTPFSKVKCVIDAIAFCYDFRFQILGASKAERCEKTGIFDGIKSVIELMAEIKNNELYVDNKKMKINEFKDFLINKPGNVYGYSVFISCSDDSLFGSFYQVIETCHQSGNAYPYIHIQ